MASFSAGTTFTDGVANDVTAAKLGALVNNATPTSGLIQDRTTETIVGSNDTLLLGDASDSNNLKKMTVANVFKSELTGTINSTSGTITTATIPTLVATTLVTTGTGTAASPAIVPTGDTNTGIFFPAADTIAFAEGGTESMRIDSSGRVGIGTTQMASSDADLHIFRASGATVRLDRTGAGTCTIQSAETGVGLRDLTLNANTLLLNTASTERLRIDSSGNVGIGTASPSGPLHIRGATGRYAFPATSGTTQSSGLTLRLNDASDDNAILDIGGNSTSGYWLQVTNNANLATNYPLLLNPNGGNVGIGTTSPSTKLHVDSGSVAQYGKFNSTAANGGYLTFESSSTVHGDIGTAAQVVSGGSASDFGINARGSRNLVLGTNNTERLRIDSSGRVGIGMTPASLLDISKSDNTGSVTDYPALRVTNTNSTQGNGTSTYNYARIDVKSGNGTVFGDFGTRYDSLYSGAFIGTESSHPVIFQTGGTERLRIDSSGFVSIGTATGLSALHVHGNVTLSNTTTATSAGTGGLSKPATYAGYLTVSINGTSRKIPYYAT